MEQILEEKIYNKIYKKIKKNQDSNVILEDYDKETMLIIFKRYSINNYDINHYFTYFKSNKENWLKEWCAKCKSNQSIEVLLWIYKEKYENCKK